MDLTDWNISTKNADDSQVFNDESIIKYEKLNTKSVVIENEHIVEEKVEKVYSPQQIYDFNENNINTEEDLLDLVYNLKGISTYLKINVKNKGIRVTDNNTYTKDEFDEILNYLFRMRDLCDVASRYFVQSGRSQAYQNVNIAPFKTSSYKSCQQQKICFIHKYDNKRKCDKNHFVFETVINDINCLIDTLQILELDNINWMINDKIVSMSFDENIEAKTLKDYNFTINKIIKNEFDESKVDNNIFNIDKKLLCKSFDVISFTLKAMYEEASYFLSKKIKSSLINLKINEPVVNENSNN